MGNAIADERDRVEVLQLYLGAEFRFADGTDGDVRVAAQLALLHVAVGNAAVDHRGPERRQVGERLLGRVHRRIGYNFHQRRAGAVVVDQGIGRAVVELADILLEVNPGERNSHVLAHHVAGGAGQLDFHRTAEADRLVVLGNLVVLRRVRIEIVFPVPFADRRDLAAQQQARLDDGVECRLVHHRQGAGKAEHDRIGQRVGLVSIARADAGEDLGAGLDLDVDLEPDDGFVVHEESSE